MSIIKQEFEFVKNLIKYANLEIDGENKVI